MSRSNRKLALFTALLFLAAATPIAFVVGPFVTMGYVEHLYSSGTLPRTRGGVNRTFWFMSARTVPDSDLGPAYLSEMYFGQPHILVRYSRFGVPLHVVYEPDGETVRVIIPTYE